MTVKSIILLVSILFLLQSQLSHAQKSKIDSILFKLKTQKIDTNKVNLYYELSWRYRIDGDCRRALKNGMIALKLSKKLNFQRGTANIYNSIGAIYSFQGNYAEGLKYYFKSLKIRETIGEKGSIALSYNNIALVFANQKSYEDALKYNLKALKLQEKIGDEWDIALSYNNIGLIYMEQEKFDLALINFFNAKNICLGINDKWIIGGILSNIGEIYEQKGKYDSALAYHFESLNVYENTDDSPGKSEANIYIGKIYGNQKKYSIGIQYLIKGINLAEKAGLKEALKIGYFNLSNIHYSMSKYKESLRCYKLYISYRDSLINEVNSKKIIQTQMQYEFDKQQSTVRIKAVEKTKQEKFRHNQEIQQQKMYTYAGIGGFCLMLVVAFVSFRAFKNKQNANLVIALQKELVEDKQKEILDSIHYAKRIQMALSPSDTYIVKSLKKLNHTS